MTLKHNLRGLGYVWIFILSLSNIRSSVSGWRASSYSYLRSARGTFTFPWGNLTFPDSVIILATAMKRAGFCPHVQVSCPSWWIMYPQILFYGHIEDNFCVFYKTQGEDIHYIFNVSNRGLWVIFQVHFSTGERLCLIRIYVSLFAKAARELQA